MNNNIGDIRTLKQITEDNVNTDIVIPKFQRDYAQGRPGKEELRNNFLADLFKVVENPYPTTAPQRVYDFIYGQQEPPNSKHKNTNRFFPIDGQQRLTTIFLLTLYLGKRGNKDTKFLKQFSYETRDSSLQFCDWLCDINASDYCNIIEFINNHPKMTGAWQSDPTISGMKQTLSDIHAYFSKIAHPDYDLYWENATQKIAFWRLYITDLDATDDLYIKMNSRGKHLSDFENFKAEVDQLAKNSGIASGEFSKELDTTWTNLFWGYRIDANDFIVPDYDQPDHVDFTDNGLDDKMLTFFRNYLIIEGVKNGVLEKSADADEFSSIKLVKLVLSASRDIFENIKTVLKYLDNKKDSQGKLKTFFEKFLSNIEEEKRFKDNPSDQTVKINLLFKSGTDLFLEMMTSQLSLNQKLVIEAFVKFILLSEKNNSVTSCDFKDRLRILRNLIANSELHDDGNHPGKMCENLKAVDKLIEFGLSSIMTGGDEFSGVQKNHEKDKLDWIKGASSKDVIALKQIENYEVVRGNLTQIAGRSSFSAKKIENFREIFCFSADYDLIEKALIAYGNYYFTEQKSYGMVYNYAGAGLVRFRDSIFVSSNKNSLDTFEKILNAPKVSPADLQSYCDSILANAVGNHAFDWNYYIIKYQHMRWAPTGHYLLPAGCNYLFYMFRASTCYHSDNYLHWNVYNEAVRCECGFAVEDIDKYGGPLTIPTINVKMDIVEDRINLHLADGADYYIMIPQTNGVDAVDRVRFAKLIVKRLLVIAKNSEDNAENGMVAVSAVDSSKIDALNCNFLKKIISDV